MGVRSMMSLIEQLMDDGFEPNLAILTAFLGPEEAQKKLDEWRFISLARRAENPR